VRSFKFRLTVYPKAILRTERGMAASKDPTTSCADGVATTTYDYDTMLASSLVDVCAIVRACLEHPSAVTYSTIVPQHQHALQAVERHFLQLQ